MSIPDNVSPSATVHGMFHDSYKPHIRVGLRLSASDAASKLSAAAIDFQLAAVDRAVSFDEYLRTVVQCATIRHDLRWQVIRRRQQTRRQHCMYPLTTSMSSLSYNANDVDAHIESGANVQAGAVIRVFRVIVFDAIFIADTDVKSPDSAPRPSCGAKFLCSMAPLSRS